MTYLGWILVGASLLSSSTVAAQVPLAEYRGLGATVADLGDVDGDGIRDFLAGDRLHGVSGRTLKALFDYSFPIAPPAGELVLGAGDRDGDGYGDILIETTLFSGGALLFPIGRGGFLYPIGSLPFPAVSLYVVGGVARLDDLDGDGVDELAAGWPDCTVNRCPSDHPSFLSGQSGGAARILSSRTGLPLHEFEGEIHDGLGGVVARLGDLDGDGFADLGIATRRPPSTSTPFCSFPEGNFTRAVSAASGTTLWEVSPTARSLAPTDDLDGDGVDDVAFGLPYVGRVELRSGRTGALIRSFSDAFLGNGTHLFGNTVRSVPDVDGDGLGDLLVSAQQPWIFPIGVPGGPTSAGPGHVLVVSTRTGKPLLRFSGKRRGDEFGTNVCLLDDGDGDGSPEIAVGSQAGSGGLVQVFSLLGGAGLPLRSR